MYCQHIVDDHKDLAKLLKATQSLSYRHNRYMLYRDCHKTPFHIGLIVDGYIHKFEQLFDDEMVMMIPQSINQMLYDYLLYEYYKLLDAKIWISLITQEIFEQRPLIEQLSDGVVLCKLLHKLGIASPRKASIAVFTKEINRIGIEANCRTHDLFCNLQVAIQIIHDLSHQTKAESDEFDGPFIDSPVIYQQRNQYGMSVMTETNKSLYELI